MATISKLTVDISFNISLESAKKCLKIVEWYCEQNKCGIISEIQENGTDKYMLVQSSCYCDKDGNIKTL